MSYLDAKAAFVTAAGSISGITALDHEPEQLPSLPCVTLLFIQSPQTEWQTGGTTQVEWTYRVTLYVPLHDYAAVNTDLETYVPALLNITRADPHLGDNCEWALITDRGEEPAYAQDGAWVRKNLYLTITTEEAPS